MLPLLARLLSSRLSASLPGKRLREGAPGSLLPLTLGLVVGLSCTPAALAQSDVVPALAETESAGEETLLGRVIQAGAKVVSKGGNPAATPEIVEAEAKGNSTAAARKQAQASIPLDKLTESQRERVQQVLEHVSFYRRLPKVSFPVEPEIYTYFVSHPDVAVSIWRAMQISKVQMFQTGKFEYEADAGDGSVGAIEIIHTSPELRVALCDGTFTSPLFKNPIEAHSLLVLQTAFITEPSGEQVVTHRADLFISFPSQTLDAAARVFSPLTVNLTDKTFTEVSAFVRMMSLAMSRRPDWVEQISQKMDGVADIRKKQLVDLSLSAHNESVRKAGTIVYEFDTYPAAPAAGTSPAPAKSTSAEPPRRLPKRGPASGATPAPPAAAPGGDRQSP